MSTYDTLNPMPSFDPRDLDDNAKAFDRFIHSLAATELDRFGVPRKTWHQMEIDAAALVSPNVTALSGLTLAVNKGIYATGVGALATYDLTALGRTLGGIANEAAGRAALQAAASGANTDITSITGSSASLTTSRSLAATGDAAWSVTFNGTASVTSALTLASVGTAGTYGSVTTDAKGRVTGGSVSTPVVNGGTGGTTKLSAGAALGVSAVGTNTTELAQSAMIQAEIAYKRPWASYTPTITPTAGTFTTISATGTYLVMFGICYVRITITVTTKGTGTFPVVSLPAVGLAGHNGDLLLVREGSTGKMGNALLTSARDGAYVSGYDASDLSITGASIVINGSYPVA